MRDFDTEAPLPVVLLQRNAGQKPQVILSKKEMQQMSDLLELIAKLEAKLNRNQGRRSREFR
jgi:hypothetical protein